MCTAANCEDERQKIESFGLADLHCRAFAPLQVAGPASIRALSRSHSSHQIILPAVGQLKTVSLGAQPVTELHRRIRKPCQTGKRLCYNDTVALAFPVLRRFIM